MYIFNLWFNFKITFILLENWTMVKISDIHMDKYLDYIVDYLKLSV